ncbi:hypothetical protein HBI67_136720 [Parastagonospora nodorum]|nr:hypothetical protein HBI66_198820 [Parastagonospora nodorum]KAH6063173.1 hypothetical protein HBI67_136720 [Parastagonospora nodorum]
MSAEIPTPDESPRDKASPTQPQRSTRTPRVLACVLCQSRKVKCDRKFPCANCAKAGVQCVSAPNAPRPRRKRFAERDLLDRLRHYEDLLRKNDVQFEPLHPDMPTLQAAVTTRRAGGEGEAQPSTPYRAKNFWDAMNRQPQPRVDDLYSSHPGDAEEYDMSDGSGNILRETELKTAWDSLYDNSDHLLFCSRNTSVDLLPLHPSQIHIFKIWQIYLERFDPMLKVTHAPTLQARIIDAASDLTKIDPAFEALMFSIYCVSIFSLGVQECEKLFGASREDLLSGYQLGAREALLNCRFMRTGDREVLTALHFYLMTVKPLTDPRALSSMLGIATRIAQRMGLHDESANRKHPALEAELRRRLWWSLVLFDARISEMTDFRLGLLLPTWDCKLPLNANDFDFRPEMNLPPEVHGVKSEAIFAVVRAEFGDFTRHCASHLDFINPALKPIARSRQTTSADDEFTMFEQMIEEKYLRFCDPQNPLQYMTLWWARGQHAKTRFIKYLAESSMSPKTRTDTELDAGISCALSMLQCDTKIMSAEFGKKFRWLNFLNFPFPAYVHIVYDLRKRPDSDHAPLAWDIMSENCAARFADLDDSDRLMNKRGNPFFKIFAGVVFQAWTAREAAMAQTCTGPVEPPAIVTQIKTRITQIETWAREEGTQDDVGESLAGDANALLGTGTTASYQDFVNVDPEVWPAFQEQASMGMNWAWPTPHYQGMTEYLW